MEVCTCNEGHLGTFVYRCAGYKNRGRALLALVAVDCRADQPWFVWQCEHESQEDNNGGGETHQHNNTT